MATLIKLSAREILDSRGNPTVEATVVLDDGIVASASVPSGASTGEHEAWELRDGDEKRYRGKGVLKAIENIESIIQPALLGWEVSDQSGIDQKLRDLDGTANKASLGANAILAVSLSIARAAADSQKVPLYEYLHTLFGSTQVLSREHFPVPMFNVINGGLHADSGISVQEFKIVPKGIAAYPESLRAGSEIFHALQELLHKQGYTTDSGDEGGFAPRLESHEEAFRLLTEAIEKAGYTAGTEVSLDIDAAASNFYSKEKESYFLKPEKATLSREQLMALYKEWAEKFPIFSFEDPLYEEDWEGWRTLCQSIGTDKLVIGDDLLVTNPIRIQEAIDKKACNALLVKTNQIGTLTETFQAVQLAQAHDFSIVVSHRSGETCDTFISDLAVAVGADYIKAGAPSRGERVAKYNRLLEIYHHL